MLDGLATLLTFAGLIFLIFLALRWVMCWYWKINEVLAALDEIRKQLKRNGEGQWELLEEIKTQNRTGLLLRARELGITVDDAHTGDQVVQMIRDRLAATHQAAADQRAKDRATQALLADQEYQLVLEKAKAAGVDVSGTPTISELLAAIQGQKIGGGGQR